jgi:hypothetical protein
MPVPRGEDPSLDHLVQLMEHDQLSAMIVGRLVIERRVAPIPPSFPNHNEGAHGPSLSGTGDVSSKPPARSLLKSVQLALARQVLD